jgi:hypothetical protein
VYLPGSPNRSSTSHVYPDASWIQAVSNQGWGIWPIWFGLQSTCLNFNPGNVTQFISTNLAQALSQGAQQADAAYNAATNTGFDGSIIYFDIEPYSTSSSSCSAAVQAYVGAFVQEYHEDGPGSAVGTYAHVSNASGDIYNSSPRPDEIWVANNAGNRATVWGLGLGKFGKIANAALTDDLWNNHQ